ncbi:hypothetical protein EAH68_09515 [Corynebacterium hylobatis]|uniref:LppP/LprE family lipoprotein n=1 Tax=Corynebacterium hylobatis TaxID=1859290 RepID=A0A430HWZ8_9CORY|nr:LppP/LprE family lipoprotein [Corynebacterium hylobatis]RSZ62369.1 hypothetical protein EAH68_09515 [Corynebacterium hylobatis]
MRPLIILTALLLAGCAGEDLPPEQTTVTVTTTPPAAPPPTSTTVTAEAEACGVSTQAAAIHENIRQVPAPTAAGEWWEYYGQSNYNPCADLSYALVWVTGSDRPLKQSQLMLFHRGSYIGVGALAPQHLSVVDADDTSVHTRMLDFEAKERDQAPDVVAERYQVDVTFWWNGERVEPIGEIPNQSLAVPLPH